VDKNIESGETECIIEAGFWKTFYDKNSGWICYGDTTMNPEDRSVEFCTNVVVVLNEGCIKGIWLNYCISIIYLATGD